MMKSVEPERFEKIVLAPVLKKVCDLYQKTNYNLLYTTWLCSGVLKTCFGVLDDPLFRKYFCEENVIDAEFEILRASWEENIKESEVNNILNESLKPQITEEAILEYFNVLVKSLSEKSDPIVYKEIINQNKRQRFRVLETDIIEIAYCVFSKELLFVAKIIDRYERDNQQRENKKSFNTVLLDFI